MNPLLVRKRDAIAKMFSDIASRYDLLNHLLSGWLDIRWRKFAAEWLPASAQIVIDVGTGTGDFAFAASDKCKGATIIGVDLSEQMLKLARKKATNMSKGRQCQWLLADGLSLPFSDEIADAVVSAFVIRNFEDLTEGLKEIHRVLKQGGVALILEFCQPPQSWWWTPAGLFVRYAVPLLGRFLSDAIAYSYLTASIQTFVPAEEVAEKLTLAGFRKVAWLPLTFSVATLFRVVK